ncbi:MAG: hypothetical protein HKN91_16675 [Acidimicrobiia bacterium]|nr:hypothetical protein [Acidimicrobiia bacterium]
MPDGTVDFDTRAAGGVSGSEEIEVFAFSVPADALIDGVNVIAVEVHQRGRRSSDLAFNLALRGVA